jgi:hypothetical protein
MPTMQSDRVTPPFASWDHNRAATSAVLAASPSGTVSARTRKPAALSAPHAGLAISPRLSAWMTTAVLASLGTKPGSSLSTPTPTTTW